MKTITTLLIAVAASFCLNGCADSGDLHNDSGDLHNDPGMGDVFPMEKGMSSAPVFIFDDTEGDDE